MFPNKALPPTGSTPLAIARWHGIFLHLSAVATLGRVLIPLTFVAPSAKTLVAGIVACEMTVLDESLLLMAAGNERNLFVVAHLGCDGEVDDLTASALLNYSRHQHYMVMESA
jgi:hypothetical protein